MEEDSESVARKPRSTMYSVRQELFDATPMEVWREYANNGYTWAEMIDEELSYAEEEVR